MRTHGYNFELHYKSDGQNWQRLAYLSSHSTNASIKLRGVGIYWFKSAPPEMSDLQF